MRFAGPALAVLCSLGAAPFVRAQVQPSANDILAAAREAIGGSAKLDKIHSLSIWGADKRAGQSSVMQLQVEMPGRFLQERTTMGNGGQIGRTVSSEDGATSAEGGMPGDSGGPALTSYMTECVDDDRYWAKLRDGSLEGGPENMMAARQRNFTQAFVLYMLALTLSPPSRYPMTWAYGQQVESPGGHADGLVGRGSNGFMVHLFIDTKSHVPVMIEYKDGARDMQLGLNDRKPEDGILFPHSLVWQIDGNPIEEFQLQKFKINPKLSPSTFAR